MLKRAYTPGPALRASRYAPIAALAVQRLQRARPLQVEKGRTSPPVARSPQCPRGSPQGARREPAGSPQGAEGAPPPPTKDVTPTHT